MKLPSLPQSVTQALVIGSLILMSSRVDASSYYSLVQVDSKTWDDTQKLGLTMTLAERSQLPGATVSQGVLYPTNKYYSMTAWANNESGTVIGGLPSGQVRSDPQENLTLGYSLHFADGVYGPFVPLTNQFKSNTGLFLAPTGFYLDNANQILIDDGRGVRLLDLNSGTTSDLTQLLPPGALNQYGIILDGTLAANGVISMITQSSTGQVNYFELLPPTPAPEPSTLVLFGAIAISLSIHRCRKISPLTGPSRSGLPRP